MKKTFVGHNKPLYTLMIQKRTTAEILDVIEKGKKAGADAFGIQFCQLLPSERTRENYLKIFGACGNYPTYVTNYRHKQNEGKTDDQLCAELLELVECGATIVDVMGDMFCKTEGELTDNAEAVAKQKDFIDKVHKAGGEVLMSSHVMKYTSSDRCLEIAKAHKERGADVSKMVTYADNDTEQTENLKIIDRLKNELELPFLFLCGGKCEIVRRIGPLLGCCTWLCVYEHDELSTASQPRIDTLKAIIDNFN